MFIAGWEELKPATSSSVHVVNRPSNGAYSFVNAALYLSVCEQHSQGCVVMCLKSQYIMSAISRWITISIGHYVSMLLIQIAVSMRHYLLYRDPGWRLLENGVAMATASRERCSLVCDVTLSMEGIWVWGLPSDGDESERRTFKVRICASRESGPALLHTMQPDSFPVCLLKLRLCPRLWWCGLSYNRHLVAFSEWACVFLSFSSTSPGFESCLGLPDMKTVSRCLWCLLWKSFFFLFFL